MDGRRQETWGDVLMDIAVYSLQDKNGKSRCIGIASSFGQAKEWQEASLPEDLREAYAGIQDGYPIFYAELITHELKTKYPQLADRKED